MQKYTAPKLPLQTVKLTNHTTNGLIATVLHCDWKADCTIKFWIGHSYSPAGTMLLGQARQTMHNSLTDCHDGVCYYQVKNLVEGQSAASKCSFSCCK